MARKSVTYKDAEAYIKLIKKRWTAWAEYGTISIVEDWDGNGNIAICWDGPYEWSYYSTEGSFAFEEREPEFGFKLPIVKVPRTLSHIFAEPYNPGVLMLYPNL